MTGVNINFTTFNKIHIRIYVTKELQVMHFCLTAPIILTYNYIPNFLLS